MKVQQQWKLLTVIINMKDIAIFGAGGFGREVLTLINDINKNNTCVWNIVGFYDDGKRKGESVNGYPVLGGIEELNSIDSPLSLVIAIGSPSAKEIIVSKIKNSNIDYPTIIHPNVLIGDSNSITIGKGCIICAGNIITTNSHIGDFVILNLSCTVGHDTVIDNYCAFMPTCNISGEVKIGVGTYFGTGAKIINQKSIGKNSIVGAGAVVIRDVPDNAVVAGVPAKVIKINS